MPTEDDLRRQLASASVPGALDAGSIIARSKARRRPRQVASGLVGALALTGVLVIGLQGIAPQSGGDSAVTMESADTGAGGSAPEEGALLYRTAAAAVAVCGAPVAAPTGAVDGLLLEGVFAESAAAGSERIPGVARLTNVGTSTITVSTPSDPSVAVAEAGVVVWHTNGPIELSLAILELAPGETAELRASLIPVRCGPGDDALPAFPADLPALPPGSYEISIAADVTDDTTGIVTLLISEPTTLTLR